MRGSEGGRGEGVVWCDREGEGEGVRDGGRGK